MKAPARIQPKPQPAKERPQCSNKYAILGLLEAEAERVNEQLVVAFPPLDSKPEHSRPSTATKTKLKKLNMKLNDELAKVNAELKAVFNKHFGVE